MVDRVDADRRADMQVAAAKLHRASGHAVGHAIGGAHADAPVRWWFVADRVALVDDDHCGRFRGVRGPGDAAADMRQ